MSVKRRTDLLAKNSGERVEQNHWTEDDRAFSQVLQNAVRPKKKGLCEVNPYVEKTVFPSTLPKYWNYVHSLKLKEEKYKEKKRK